MQIRVKDTGIGISREQQRHIFDKFMQGETSTARNGGTGLGLAITSDLVALMGGTLSVESTEGEGSTFSIALVLPRDKSEAGREPQQEDLSGARTLVVDDSAINRNIVTEHLAGWGIPHGEAASGEEALRILRGAAEAGDPYRIAILAHQAPGMDGVELAQRIKADKTLRDTAVISLTSLGLRGKAEVFKGLHFSAYLTKPVLPSRLFEALSTVWTACRSELDEEAGTVHGLAQDRRPDVSVKETAVRFDARVLLVEDNPINQKVGQGALERFGCEVDIAGDGRKAIEKLRDAEYDIVFMDCRMPGMEGYEATQAIRESEADDRHQIIVAMTAHAIEGVRERCIAAGMDDYLSKPLLRQELHAILAKYCRAAHTVPPEDDRRKSPGPVSPLVLNKQQLNDLLGDDIETMQKIFSLTLDNLPKRVERLAGAISSGDSGQAEREAHGIKGAAANVGGEELRETAYAVELAGKADDIDACKHRLEALQAAVERLKSELQRTEGRAS